MKAKISESEDLRAEIAFLNEINTKNCEKLDIFQAEIETKRIELAECMNIKKENVLVKERLNLNNENETLLNSQLQEATLKTMNLSYR